MPRFFRPNPNAEDELRSQPEYREGLKEIAEPARVEVAAAARAESGPWMPRQGEEPIQVVDDEDGVYIVNTDYAAAIQEYGSARTPPHAPLRRGVRAAGLRLEEQPK
jgi:hypothetical protein